MAQIILIVFLSVYMQVDPLAKPFPKLHLYQTLTALMKEEEKVLISIKDSEKEVIILKLFFKKLGFFFHQDLYKFRFISSSVSEIAEN